MKPITWDENLMLSVPQMDREHAELISLANEFTAAVSAEASRAELEIRLTHLIAGFKAHFHAEEELMRSSSFPGLTPHSIEHAKLITQISGLRDDVGSGHVSVCEALSGFVQLWTERHIQGSDSALASFIRAETTAGPVTSTRE